MPKIVFIHTYIYLYFCTYGRVRTIYCFVDERIIPEADVILLHKSKSSLYMLQYIYTEGYLKLFIYGRERR